MAHEIDERLELHGHATELVLTLREAGAKLVCIDFDATFVSVHTGGAWSKSVEELCKYVRGLFLVVVPMLLQSEIHVAVVTFSPQLELIRAVLQLCFGAGVADRMIVRCDDGSWTLAQTETLEFVPKWQVSGMHVDRAYKLPYVISAAIEASHSRGEHIRNRDTILIDDDAKNIRIANDNGITGIYFEPEGVDVKELCKRIKKLHVQPLGSVPPSGIDVQTPCKRKPVRVLATPEATPRQLSRGPPSVRAQGTPLMASMPRTKKFSLCTPSPVMKLKCTVDMGRPRSKRASKLRHCPRNIEVDLHDLHLKQGASAASVAHPTSAAASAAATAPFLMDSPHSPDRMLGSFPLLETDEEDM